MFTFTVEHTEHIFDSFYDVLDYILYLCATETNYDIYFMNTLFASVRKNGYRNDNLDLMLYSPKHTEIKMEFKSC